MKNRKTKTIIATIILIMAVMQGPVIFYAADGFLKLLLAIPYALTGLVLTIILLVSLIKHKASNATYHMLGLIIAFTIGISTLRGDVMEYIDWKCRLAERTKIVERIKGGSFKPEDDYNKNIIIKKQDNGIVSIEFIIDGGFIDHYSAFLYTNDKLEIIALNKAIQRDHIFKKFNDNWYRVGY